MATGADAVGGVNADIDHLRQQKLLERRGSAMRRPSEGTIGQEHVTPSKLEYSRRKKMLTSKQKGATVADSRRGVNEKSVIESEERDDSYNFTKIKKPKLAEETRKHNDYLTELSKYA